MQIDIEQIGVDSGRSFRAYEYDFLNRPQSFHSHPEYELAVVCGTGGIVYCGADTRVFVSGDLFLFGGRLPHRFIGYPVGGEDSPSDSRGAIAESRPQVSVARALVVQFRHDAFGKGFFGLPENGPIGALLKSADRGFVLGSAHPESPMQVNRMERIISAPGNRRLPELLLLLAGISDLNSVEALQTVASGISSRRTQDGDARRLSLLQDHIEVEYAEGANLDRAAEKLALTRTSFCRYVKRTTGRTFTELVNDYRLTMAAIRLRDGSLPVSSVAGDVGFGSLSHFNSRFRERFGMTPSEYRGGSVTISRPSSIGDPNNREAADIRNDIKYIETNRTLRRYRYGVR